MAFFTLSLQPGDERTWNLTSTSQGPNFVKFQEKWLVLAIKENVHYHQLQYEGWLKSSLPDQDIIFTSIYPLCYVAKLI